MTQISRILRPVPVALTMALALLPAALLWAGPLAAADEPQAAEPAPWSHIGLLRVRDLTPFGIVRLDFLPAHAVTAPPGTWALEANLSYQNTFVLSENVADYLEQRGGGSRVKLDQQDVDAILALGEDAYLVDLELGLVDLTLHYRFSSHWGGYLTVPAMIFRDGNLDSTIEDFHQEFGFSTAHRDLMARNNFQAAIAIGDTKIGLLDPPENGLGDPVLGARYSLLADPKSWNLILESAVKVGWRKNEPFLSSGRSDAGLQVSLQKFFQRQALYLTASAVYFGGSANRFTPDFKQIIPTVVIGWEHRLTRYTNTILQLYASPSLIEDSTLDELTADKYLASLGTQTHRGHWFYRFALTENLQNFSNTPDIGLTFSVARVAFGH